MYDEKGDVPVAVMMPSLLILADLKRRLSSVNVPSFCLMARSSSLPSSPTSAQLPDASTTIQPGEPVEVVIDCVARMSPVTADLSAKATCRAADDGSRARAEKDVAECTARIGCVGWDIR